MIVPQRGGPVFLPEFEIGLATLLEELERVVPPLVCLLDDALRSQALDVALHLREHGAGLFVLLHLVAAAEHVDELGNVRDHLVDARVPVRHAVEREDVDALQVQLRGVDRRVVVRVVVRDFLEARTGLLPVLCLEVQTAACVLHLNELLDPVSVRLFRMDVTNVPIEGLDHRLLRVRHVLRPVHVVGVPLDVLSDTRQIPAALLVGPLLVLRQIDVLVAEHRRVRGLGRFRRVRVLLDDRVERRSALAPLLSEVEDFDQARDLELGELVRLPRVRHLLIEAGGEIHGPRVARAALPL